LVFPVVSFLLVFPPISYVHSSSPPFEKKKKLKGKILKVYWPLSVVLIVLLMGSSVKVLTSIMTYSVILKCIKIGITIKGRISDVLFALLRQDAFSA
jgi:hypothetical protein